MDDTTDVAGSLESRRVHIADAVPPVGADQALAAIRSVVMRVRHPVPGCPAPRGLLISGPTGTGKTSLARAMAAMLPGVPAYDLPADIEPERLRAVLDHLAGGPRVVLFIPEVDSLGLDRSISRDARRNAGLCALLESIDGLVGGPSDRGPLLVATSSRADMLDPALLRPGRLSIHVRLDPPAEDARAAVLAHYLQPLPADRVDLATLALLSRGSSGAELRQMVEEAYGRAVDRGGPGTPISQGDLVAALRRGSRVETQDRPDLVAARMERAAIHEAGHAVAAARLGLPVAAIRLGESGHEGSTDLGREGRSRTDTEIRATVIVAMAGSAAERLLLPETGGSLGSRDDVRQATALLIARIEAGLDPCYPPISRRAYVEYGATPMDEAISDHVCALLVEARQRAEAIVAAEVDVVRRLVDRLLVDPVLAGDALRIALIDAGAAPAVPTIGLEED